MLLIAAMALPAIAVASNCNGTQTGLIPLTALGAGTYQGHMGGLYPGGSNTRPPAHDATGLAVANAIASVDTFGNADPNGRVVMISIGMSNCTQEFSTFVPLSNADASRDPNVRVIDCARGGQTASLIKSPTSAYWDTVDTRLRGVGSSPAQVQVAWIKEANAGPTTGFPAATTTLMQDLGSVVRTLKDHLPNLKIAYLSSRTYAGYASTALNPEAYAYESGFAVKWLIEGQIAGEDSLNHDPGQGPVESPWLAWGPYLWADGLDPRPGDGLTYACADFVASDGTHPSISGRAKVANLLLDFLQTDATARPWYLAATASVTPAAAAVLPLTLAPNPTVRDVEVSFTARPGEPWRLDVLDLAGRRVRELGEGVGDGSAQVMRWDARDGRGGRLRAGVYWVRLESGRDARARRVALLGAD
jgi:hypothetical protein